MQKITDFFFAGKPATRSATTNSEDNEDFYCNALKKRIKEVANANKDDAEEMLNSEVNSVLQCD